MPRTKEQGREWAAKNRAKKIAEGLCIFGGCRMVPTNGQRCCVVHAEKMNEYSKALHARRYANPEIRKQMQKARRAYLARVKEQSKRWRADYQRSMRAACFKDKFCVCCGEPNPIFLTIDHVKGDGAQRRRNNRGRLHNHGNNTLYRQIVKYGWPADLQVLCYNCNCAKRQNDHCPHEDELRAMIIRSGANFPELFTRATV